MQCTRGSRTWVSTTSGGKRGTRCLRTQVSTTNAGKSGTRCSRTRDSTTTGGKRGTRCSRTRISTTSGGKRRYWRHIDERGQIKWSAKSELCYLLTYNWCWRSQKQHAYSMRPHFSSWLSWEVDGGKGKILIWFVQQWRMHLLLTKEALTIVALLACLT